MLTVKHGERLMQAWEISHATPTSDWIQAGFKHGLLSWDALDDNRLRLNSAWSFTLGEIGDYIITDHDELKLIPKKRFLKEYQIIH